MGVNDKALLSLVPSYRFVCLYIVSRIIQPPFFYTKGSLNLRLSPLICVCHVENPLSYLDKRKRREELCSTLDTQRGQVCNVMCVPSAYPLLLAWKVDHFLTWSLTLHSHSGLDTFEWRKLSYRHSILKDLVLPKEGSKFCALFPIEL